MRKPKIKDVEAAAPEASNIHEIGTGAFKVVYRANINGNDEALKIAQIPGDTPEAKQENIARIHREIKTLQECRCPHLVKLGTVAPREVTISGDDFILYSEEFIPGNSLREIIKLGSLPPIEQLVEIGLGVLDAVNELSKFGIVHRDIKPENLMMTSIPGRKCILLDLGIAFKMGGTLLTGNAFFIPGTIYYIAPEMLEPGFRNNLDSRADIYTIGLTIYEFASGKNPFMNQGDNNTTLFRIQTTTPVSLEILRPDLPKEFCKLIDQMIKKIPALRPANISRLMKKMEAFL